MEKIIENQFEFLFFFFTFKKIVLVENKIFPPTLDIIEPLFFDSSAYFIVELLHFKSPLQ